MRQSVRIFNGKTIPIWLAVMALVAAGSGAAVGTVLAGNVIAEIPVTISQALLVGKPVVVPSNTNMAETDILTEDDCLVDNMPQGVDHLDGNPTDIKVVKGYVYAPDRSIGAVNDQETAFQFAAEIDQHDWYAFCVPLKNSANQDMVCQLTMVCPEGITVEAMDGGDATKDYVDSMTRTGPYTWKFELKKDADKTAPVFTSGSEQIEDCIIIVVAASDTIAPGFYTIVGEIVQISY